MVFISDCRRSGSIYRTGEPGVQRFLVAGFCQVLECRCGAVERTADSRYLPVCAEPVRRLMKDTIGYIVVLIEAIQNMYLVPTRYEYKAAVV